MEERLDWGERINEAAVRAAVWGFVGLFFGVLYLLFVVFIEQWGWPVDPRLAAGIIAGTIGALIYGSMRLAVIVAIVVSLICLFLFTNVAGAVAVERLLLLLVPVGALIGALYGGFQRRSDCYGPDCSRVYRADAKGVAGLVSGAGASMLYFSVIPHFASPPFALTVAVLCVVGGLLYVAVLPFCLRRFTELLPPAGDGAVVGAGAALFVGLFYFVLVGGIEPELVGALAGASERIHASLLDAVLGGVLGSGAAGFLRGLLRVEWTDL